MGGVSEFGPCAGFMYDSQNAIRCFGYPMEWKPGLVEGNIQTASTRIRDTVLFGTFVPCKLLLTWLHRFCTTTFSLLGVNEGIMDDRFICTAMTVISCVLENQACASFISC